MNDLPQHSRAETTRRGLLARNIKAIALVAAGALVTKLTPAKAGEDESGHDGGHCFLRGTKIQTVERERPMEALSVDEATREERSRQCRSWAAHFQGDGAIDA